jgi:hypothetical protein
MDKLTMPPAGPIRRDQRPRRCSNCGLPPLGFQYLKRGRCDACYTYWHKYDRERPPHLWRRDFTGR